MQLASRLTQLNKLSNGTDHPESQIFDIAALACAGHAAAKFNVTADSPDIVSDNALAGDGSTDNASRAVLGSDGSSFVRRVMADAPAYTMACPGVDVDSPPTFLTIFIRDIALTWACRPTLRRWGYAFFMNIHPRTHLCGIVRGVLAELENKTWIVFGARRL